MHSRIGEARLLTWSHVDADEGVVRLNPGETKNEEGRTWPFSTHPRLAGLLHERVTYTEAVQRRRDKIVPWVFHNEGEQIGDFRKAWATACEVAGVPGKLRHDLRRTAVRNLVRAGVPERVAMTLTGHKTRAVFDRYNIVSGADLAEGVRKLSGEG